MKMCDKCYSLFEEESILINQCPIFKCEGDLVDVDSEVAEYISLLNQHLSDKDIQLRTLFTCAGHISELSVPYIGFEIITSEEEEANKLAQLYSKRILEDLVEKLNQKLIKISGIQIKNLYDIEYSVLEEEKANEHQFPRFRLFVNAFNYQMETENHFQQIRIIEEIQHLWKNFLIELIEKIDEFSEEMSEEWMNFFK